MNQWTLEAARRGSREAQAALLRQLQDVWYRFCLGICGGADDAQDAVQETALRFLRDLHKFRGDSTLSTWSLGIALNVCREQRRRSRPAEDLDDDEPQLAAASSSAPPTQAESGEMRSLLRAGLNELPDRQREAVLLRYFEELSVEETAAAMSCAVGTVKATVHQALRALRAKLKQLT